MPALLIRDLAQVVSPGGPAPLRGAALGEVRIVEDGYVLCDGGRIREVGRMSRLDPATVPDEVVEVDGRGRAVVPGLVDCHTHACFAGDRAAEFELRSRGASYEELHAAGGGILSTVSATRAAGEAALAEATERHRGWMLAHGTTTFEAKSGYGLDLDTELAQLRAVARAGGIPTYLGAHAVPPEFPDGDAYLDFALAEVLPEAAALAEAADVFVEQGRVRRRPGAALPRPRAARPGWRFVSMPTSSARRAGSSSPSSSARAASTTWRQPGQTAFEPLRRRDVAAVLLPVAALTLGRPMPPARALVEAGATVVLATDFNPGSAFCESLPVVMSLACTQLGLAPAEALAACTVNAAHVLGRADRIGRLEPGFDADLLLLDASDWRYLAYHLGGEHVALVVKEGEVAWER